ncbi:YcbK family protein [Mesorhizobium sp. WSM2239]|uniref:YcbK family protein n=2 Tax=unclassified Mesorhizobium TaxID=325217 RepID=A0AAU8D2A5_9HYPH
MAKRNGRAIAAVLTSVLLASCTSSTDPNLEIGMPGYNATDTAGGVSSGDLQSAGVDVAPQPVMNAESDTPLPTQVGSVPALKSAGETAATATAEAGATPAAVPATVAETAKPPQAEAAAEADAKPAEVAASGEAAERNATESAMPAAQPPRKKGLLSALFSPAPAAQPAAAAETAKPEQAEAAAADDSAAAPATASAALPTPKPAQAADEAKPAEASAAPTAEKPAAENAVYVTAGEMPAPQPIAPKKKSFLSAFFGTSPASAAPSPIKQRQESKPIVETESGETKPIVTLASAKAAEKPVRMASLGNDNALPGVRQTALFEIKRKSGIDDDSDVDLHEDEDGGPVLASAAGLARLAPNGLLKQTDRVDVACLKPSLVRALKTVERHYGKKMVITSGYRSPAHNRRARGAKNSLHMYCAAVDVQIPGVSKWELAEFVRSMPGRGGVGTYCHTESVHIDVGPERDWNWRCRRRKG